MQMLAEEILSPLSVKQDRRIAGLASISDFSSNVRLKSNSVPFIHLIYPFVGIRKRNLTLLT
jgi:hypothetical protein